MTYLMKLTGPSSLALDSGCQSLAKGIERASRADLAEHGRAGVKRLEERGVIQGYGARVNLAALGYSLQALVRVRPLPGLLQKVDKYIQAMPECIESDKVTGGRLFRDAPRGARYCPVGYPAGRSGQYAQCNTSVVKSSPVKGVCHRCEFPRRRCCAPVRATRRRHL